MGYKCKIVLPFLKKIKKEEKKRGLWALKDGGKSKNAYRVFYVIWHPETYVMEAHPHLTSNEIVWRGVSRSRIDEVRPRRAG